MKRTERGRRSGLTEKDWRDALAEVLSPDFDVRMNLAGGVGAFVKAAGSEPSVMTLLRLLNEDSRYWQRVLIELTDMSRAATDRRYQNPNDVALAILLLLVASTGHRGVLAAADTVDRAPETWYAKKIARRILNPRPGTSGSYIGASTSWAKVEGTSGERMTSLNIGVLGGAVWADREVVVDVPKRDSGHGEATL